MDNLIKCLENFNLVDSKQFEDDLDSITERMTDMKVYGSNPDVEWRILSQNYSKLRYLCHLIEVFPVKSAKFYNSINVFFQMIDTVNQNYLREIDWECDEYEFEIKCLETKTLLEQSLNITDHLIKLNYILRAYSILVEIAEYFREEKFFDILDDQEFIEEFN